MAGREQVDVAGSGMSLQPENSSKKYEQLFQEIDSGRIKLPMFQRDFVWDKERSARLIDSILKGYPIGTFILWNTRETLRTVKNIGNHPLPQLPKGDYAQLVLDGQQRMTSLYAIRKGIRLTHDGKEVDYKDIYINLDKSLAQDQVVTTRSDAGGTFISVHELLSGSPLALFNKFPGKRNEIESYKVRLTAFDFPTITIRDYPVAVACDVFARINTGGKSLTVFEIMAAMTYDEKRNFDLSLKCDALIRGGHGVVNCLAKSGFETIPDAVILQTVAAIVRRSVRGKEILAISRDEFINAWDDAQAAIFSAVDFIRGSLGIHASQLLPYPALIIPISLFFHLNANKKPKVVQVRRLRQFFYWAGWTERYSGSTESKVTEDLHKVETIVGGAAPKYDLEELDATAEVVADIKFHPGSASVKAILCLLAANSPLSLDNNARVPLDNRHLKIASSRNYHHFFPKAFVSKKFPEMEANLLVNIALIDAESNNKIGSKAPSRYVAELRKGNPRLRSALASHLIGDVKQFGIDKDNYARFVKKRSAALAEALGIVLSAKA